MRIRESWGRPLSDGTYLQVVYDPETMQHYVELERRPHCFIRLGPITASDAYWLNGAIDEAHPYSTGKPEQPSSEHPSSALPSTNRKDPQP